MSCGNCGGSNQDGAGSSTTTAGDGGDAPTDVPTASGGGGGGGVSTQQVGADTGDGDVSVTSSSDRCPWILLLIAVVLAFALGRRQ